MGALNKAEHLGPATDPDLARDGWEWRDAFASGRSGKAIELSRHHPAERPASPEGHLIAVVYLVDTSDYREGRWIAWKGLAKLATGNGRPGGSHRTASDAAKAAAEAEISRLVADHG